MHGRRSPTGPVTAYVTRPRYCPARSRPAGSRRTSPGSAMSGSRAPRRRAGSGIRVSARRSPDARRCVCAPRGHEWWRTRWRSGSVRRRGLRLRRCLCTLLGGLVDIHFDQCDVSGEVTGDLLEYRADPPRRPSGWPRSAPPTQNDLPDARCHLQIEPGVHIRQIAVADLTDALQPVAQGAAVDRQRGGRIVVVASAVEVA